MKLKLVLLILALQTAWLLGTVAVQEHILAAGEIILLETQRVDPRDLLRGDYLILNYKISGVPVTAFSRSLQTDLASGTKIYVALAPGTNDYFEIRRASLAQITPAPDEVVLVGKTVSDFARGAASVRVTYGIEKYFVAENTGNPSGTLTVQVAVSASGHPKIKQVLLDGRPYAEVMREKSP